MNVGQAFTEEAVRNNAIDTLDEGFLANELRAIIGTDDLSQEVEEKNLFQVVETLVKIAEGNGRIEALDWTCEMFETKLYGLLTPLPSVVHQTFQKNYQISPVAACAYFYDLSCRNNYIKTREIAQNIHFLHPSEYGELEITINLSKPEKDPKEIALAKLAPQSDFPKCQLCMENEGYLGRVNHPARSNHRIVRCQVEDETWGFQYSPYAYYEEHCIFLNETHQPMVIDKTAFRKILSLVDIFPHYFVGSNADLPIVGGSILTHEHFQGGRAVLPMAKAGIREEVVIGSFQQVKAGILEWPMSVIRLASEKLEELVQCATFIHEQWKKYSDESVEVLAQSPDGTPHHTVTPIARKNGTVFELDLVLRDNHVTTAFPDGVFHPHQDVHHIKKENIGLIEVMGLAILPPRLKEELKEVENFLEGRIERVQDIHQEWANELKNQYTKEDVHEFVNQAVGKKFERVLEDAGVFKKDEQGKNAFQRFIRFMEESIREEA